MSSDVNPPCPFCNEIHEITICAALEELLPSMEVGRVDYEDLPRLYLGRLMRRIILDNEESLTERQQEVVRLYYREGHYQKEIAEMLSITQQGVSDHLEAVKNRLWKQFRKNRDFKATAQARGVFD